MKRLAAAWADRCQAADRITRGTGIVYRRRADALTAWVRAGRRTDLTGWRAALGPLVRLAMLGAAAAVLYGVVRAVPWLMWLLTGAWLRAAWKAGTPPAQEAPEVVEEPPAEPRADPGREAVLTLLHEVIGDRRGAHLSEVLAHLQKEGHAPGWTVTDLRARLQALNIPIDPKLKLRGVPTRGVRRDALEALSPTDTPSASPAPSTAA